MFINIQSVNELFHICFVGNTVCITICICAGWTRELERMTVKYIYVAGAVCVFVEGKTIYPKGVRFLSRTIAWSRRQAAGSCRPLIGGSEAALDFTAGRAISYASRYFIFFFVRFFSEINSLNIVLRESLRMDKCG